MQAIAQLIEDRRQWMARVPLQDQNLGMLTISFNLGRLAGHTSFIASHAKPGDVVVCQNTGALHFRELVGKAGRTMPCIASKFPGVLKALSEWSGDVGDLWIDEPAWSATPQQLNGLLQLWKRKRQPDALAITMGGVYQLGP